MRPFLQNPHSLLALSLSLSLAGCVGTSTGNPTEGPGEETGGHGVSDYCKKVSSTAVEPDQQTELGFSAQEVLAFVEGTHAETLTWHPQSIASYGPESGERDLTLTVTRTSAPIRLTHYTFDANGAEIGGDCPDALEIDVQVLLQTDEGALDERFDTTLTARSSRSVRLFYSPDPEQLGGSFAVTEVHASGFELAQLDLSISLTSFGTSGELSAVFEQRTGDTVGAAPSQGPLASWGPARCEGRSGSAIQLDQAVAEFSGSDVVALLSAVESANVSFDGAAASLASVEFTASGGGVCAQLEPEPFGTPSEVGSLSFKGVLRVQSDDERIDAAWPVDVRAVPDASGALGEVSLQLDHSRVPQQGSLQARFGLSSIDASSYDSVGVSLMLALSPASPLSGELRVTGYTNPMCSTTPVMDPSGGVSVPGCPGATPTELGRAQLRAEP